jgi:very-short-patch-repair endonuclease
MQALAPFPVKVVTPEAICQFAGVRGAGEPVASWVAARQLELITATQLRLAGVSRDVVRTRMRQGTMHRVYVSVYQLGTPVMLPGAAELAAVLACGDGAVVRRRSAIALFGCADPWAAEVEILVVGRNCRRAGIDVARVPVLAPVDRGFQNGIPIVAPALALLDFASIATGDELERAIAEAYVLRLVAEQQLRDVIDRHPHRAGVVALRAELDRAGGPLWTASKAERIMKELLRKADLPPARTRVRVAGYPADFIWPELRLIVEVDGYRSHGHRYAFERDRRRDQAHKNARYEVIRVTWRQLNDEPLRVIAVIALAIGSAQAATRPLGR